MIKLGISSSVCLTSIRILVVCEDGSIMPTIHPIHEFIDTPSLFPYQAAADASEAPEPESRRSYRFSPPKEAKLGTKALIERSREEGNSIERETEMVQIQAQQTKWRDKPRKCTVFLEAQFLRLGVVRFTGSSNVLS